MNESLINFEWAAFKFNVEEALWPLRNDGGEKQKKRYSKGIFKPTTAEQNIDEKNGLKYCRGSNDNNRTS